MTINKLNLFTLKKLPKFHLIRLNEIYQDRELDDTTREKNDSLAIGRREHSRRSLKLQIERLRREGAKLRLFGMGKKRFRLDDLIEDYNDLDGLTVLLEVFQLHHLRELDLMQDKQGWIVEFKLTDKEFEEKLEIYQNNINAAKEIASELEKIYDEWFKAEKKE